MPEMYQFYAQNDRRGDWVVAMSRNKTDAPLNKKIHEHWYGTPNVAISEAIKLKYKSAAIYVPGLEGQVPEGGPDPIQRKFLMADYKEFYYYNGPASHMMKAMMLSDTGM